MLTKILDIYSKIILQVIILLMFALIFAVALQILGRYVPFIPRYLWTEEISRFSLIWVIFLGSMIGVREGKHFYVNLLPENMSPKAETILRIIYYIFMYVVALIFILFGYRYFLMGVVQESEITGMNLGAIYISVPVSGITWFIFLTESLYKEFFSHQPRGKENP